MSVEAFDPLVAELRSGGPVSPAVQMCRLMSACKRRGWEFETAWRWSYARVKWPHDTGHRRGWKEVLGEDTFDLKPVPARQRLVWQRAFENQPATEGDASVGLLVAA